MIKKIVFSFIGVLVLATAVGLAYNYSYYFIPAPDSLQQETAQANATPVAQPDPSVLSGPVTAVSTSSITISTSGGSKTTALSSGVKVFMADGQGNHTDKTLTDITVGQMVLLSLAPPNKTQVDSILILPPPPTSAHQ